LADAIFDMHRSVTWLDCGLCLPWFRVEGVMLPFLPSAHEEHDGTEEEYDGSPNQIQVEAQGLLVKRHIFAREQAKERHDSSKDLEDQAERNSDVEPHVVRSR